MVGPLLVDLARDLMCLWARPACSRRRCRCRGRSVRRSPACSQIASGAPAADRARAGRRRPVDGRRRPGHHLRHAAGSPLCRGPVRRFRSGQRHGRGGRPLSTSPPRHGDGLAERRLRSGRRSRRARRWASSTAFLAGAGHSRRPASCCSPWPSSSSWHFLRPKPTDARQQPAPDLRRGSGRAAAGQRVAGQSARAVDLQRGGAVSAVIPDAQLQPGRGRSRAGPGAGRRRHHRRQLAWAVGWAIDSPKRASS